MLKGVQIVRGHSRVRVADTPNTTWGWTGAASRGNRHRCFVSIAAGNRSVRGRNRSMSLLSEPVTLPYLDTPNEKREAHAISDGGSDKAQYRNLHELTLLGIA